MTIRVQRHGDHVAEIVLDRPEALNAISTALAVELTDVTARLAADGSVRAVVLSSSAAKAFCVGADLKERNAFTDDELRRHRDVTRRAYRGVLDLPVPAVAAVAGFALGGGCELAMMCDLIIAADNARFGQPEIKLGIIPGAGGTQRLPRAVGKAKAMDLVLTGRMMDAAEAERAGLVSRVVPLDKLMEEALATALAICEYSQVAVMAAKEAVNRAFESGLSDGVMYERRLFHALFATADQKEGMDAFLNKRKPQFRNR